MAIAEPLSATQPSLLTARGAARTDVGRRRSHNEDQVLVSDTLGLFVVADGMGGHDAGDVASAIVVASMEEYFWADAPVLSSRPDDDMPDGARRIVSSIHYGNREVYANSGRSAQQGGMGSTVVALFVAKAAQQIHICHVGDSRCYRFRNGELELLTEDHSMINEALRLNPNLSPEILKQLPSNVVTRALGTKEMVNPDVRSEALVEDDVYLLCSDGLNGEVSDDDIAFALAEADDLADTCELLINMANEAGGRDNVSAVLVRIYGDGPASGNDGEISGDDETTLLNAQASRRDQRETRPDGVPALAALARSAGQQPASQQPASQHPASQHPATADTPLAADAVALGDVELADENDVIHEEDDDDTIDDPQSAPEDEVIDVEIDVEIEDDDEPPADAAPADADKGEGRRARRSRRIAAATARLDAALEELADFDGWGNPIDAGTDDSDPFDDDPFDDASPTHEVAAPRPSGAGHLLIVPEPEDELYEARHLEEAETAPLEIADAPTVVSAQIIKVGTTAPAVIDDGPDPEGTSRCLACGHKLAPREHFCGMCGLNCDQAAASSCHHCDKPLLEDTRYCVWCGSRVDA